MITKNPLPLFPLSELFPEPHQMAHGDKRTVKRAMSTIFFALDFCRSMGNGSLTPEVWALVYAITRLGSKTDGEDEKAITHFAELLDRYIPGTMPQDIREYSVMQKLVAVQKESSDPSEFFPVLYAAMSMLADSSKKLPNPTSVLSQKILFVYAFVRDSFVAHEMIMSNSRVPLVFPVSRSSLPYVSEICRDFILEESTNQGADESWEAYVEKTWNMFVAKTFPCLGAAKELNRAPNLSKDFDGRDLMLNRLSQARKLKSNWPEDFNEEALGLVSGGFCTSSLFDSKRAQDLRKLAIPSYNMMNYMGNRRKILSGLKWSNIELVTVTSKARYQKLMEDGEFKSIWELPEDEWDASCGDCPQDARAMTDLRLWGEAGNRVIYSIGILPSEDKEMTSVNLATLARIHGKEDPMVLSLHPELVLQSSITVGAGFENFIAFPFRPETLLWLVEARMFFSRISVIPAMSEELNYLVRGDSLWRSWAMVMSGMKSPYFEFQIHGRVKTDKIRQVLNIAPDGTKFDITRNDNTDSDSADGGRAEDVPQQQRTADDGDTPDGVSVL